MRMHMLAGRWLSKDEVHARQYATVLTQTLARSLFGDDNPIGMQIQVKDFGKWKAKLHAVFGMPATQTPSDPLRDRQPSTMGVE